MSAACSAIVQKDTACLRTPRSHGPLLPSGRATTLSPCVGLWPRALTQGARAVPQGPGALLGTAATSLCEGLCHSPLWVGGFLRPVSSVTAQMPVSLKVTGT